MEGMDEIKNCPFCGGKGKLMEYDPFEWHSGMASVYRVKCVVCGASIRKEKEEMAIWAWNRRVDENG